MIEHRQWDTEKVSINTRIKYLHYNIIEEYKIQQTEQTNK